ncbi:hypothetical protein [Geodermatophilus normandii]|uniref:Uncharacterized protein n=1 Tax=Geodermatophilus normandii TaxID=1137989 RepID=A0A6P0GFY3_9ACTN|nr:hypothetical protein [Geodermatophilus normandii]NEM06169.1 hypothetical protein [Geodermatophilus normandii]
MSAGSRTDRDVDRAALLGTALAAVVALTFGGQGEWDWLAAATGIALLLVLAAFFRLPAGVAPTPRVRAELAAVSAVAALAATLVLAPVLQAALDATDAGRTCRASAAVAAGALESDEARQRGAEVAVARGDAEGPASEALSRAARDEERTVLGNCLGTLTSRWLWAPAAALAAVGYAAAWWLVRRRHAPDGAPPGERPGSTSPM